MDRLHESETLTYPLSTNDRSTIPVRKFNRLLVNGRVNRSHAALCNFLLDVVPSNTTAGTPVDTGTYMNERIHWPIFGTFTLSSGVNLSLSRVPVTSLEHNLSLYITRDPIACWSEYYLGAK